MRWTILIAITAGAFTLTRAATHVGMKAANSAADASHDTGAQVGTAVLGYLVEHAPTLAVRAISGVPGDAHLSSPMPLPEGAIDVLMAPRHAWGIVTRAGAAPLLWHPETNVLATLESASTSPDSVAFSPSGAALALYWSATAGVQVYDGSELHLDHKKSDVVLPGNLTKLAVADDGTLACIIDGRTVYVLQDGSPAISVFESASVQDAQFVPGRRDLLVADNAGDRVVEVAERGSAVRVIASSSDGLEKPVRVIAEDAWIVFARSQSGEIFRIDTLRNGVSKIEAFPGNSLERLRVRGLLLLSEQDHQAGGLYEGLSSNSTLHLVPRAADGQEAAK